MRDEEPGGCASRLTWEHNGVGKQDAYSTFATAAVPVHVTFRKNPRRSQDSRLSLEKLLRQQGELARGP